jgi:polyisoprenoid-binding protein YceI
MRMIPIARLAAVGLLAAGAAFAAAPAAPAAATPAAATTAATASGPHVFTIDHNHSVVGFSIRHLVSRVQGRFKDFTGTVTYDPQRPEASAVEMTVQAASVDTGAEKRDEDLRSDDFFDVAKYATLTFKSTAVTRGEGDALNVTGDLTMHGVTKRITIPVKVLGTMPFRGGQKAGFSTTFTVDRKEYGITWNRAVDNGGMLLGDDVQVDIQLETGWEPPKAATAPPAAAPAASPAAKPGR